MKKLFPRRNLYAGCLLFLAVISGTTAECLEKSRVLNAGDFFPAFSFPMLQARGDIHYLGLPEKFFGLMHASDFSLQEVKADLILVEFLNKHCFSCQLQAPVMNEIFSQVEKDPRLKGKVKFIGIGAGNNQGEVDSFRAEKQIPFPIIPDPRFLAYEAIGDPGVAPFCLYLRRTDSGLLVVHVEAGYTRDPDRILRGLVSSLMSEVGQMVKEFQDPSFRHFRAADLRLGLSEEELLRKAGECMGDPKWKVLDLVKLAWPDDRGIYVGQVQEGNKRFYLFARLVSRAPVCDICHAVHFFYAFDQKGMVMTFLPLEVTKEGNLPWDLGEIERMRKRVVGRSVLHPADFDPKLDSISSATMSAALIVDAINKGIRHYEGLKRMGYLGKKP